MTEPMAEQTTTNENDYFNAYKEAEQNKTNSDFKNKTNVMESSISSDIKVKDEKPPSLDNSETPKNENTSDIILDKGGLKGDFKTTGLKEKTWEIPENESAQNKSLKTKYFIPKIHSLPETLNQNDILIDIPGKNTTFESQRDNESPGNDGTVEAGEISDNSSVELEFPIDSENQIDKKENNGKKSMEFDILDQTTSGSTIKEGKPKTNELLDLSIIKIYKYIFCGIILIEIYFGFQKKVF